MKIFTGIDIIEIDRFNAGNLASQKFLDKCFTKAEQNYCLGMHTPAPHFAARFAAKEAVVKALFGLKISLLYCDIDIRKDENQRPYVVFLSDDKRLERLKIDISLSHSQNYAAANAVVYLDDE